MQSEEAGEAPPEFLSQEEKDKSTSSKWDESTISADWGEDTANIRAYNCPSCGAELMCEATTAATHCPYCGNPSIVPGQFGGTLKPDYVIPFKLDKEAAIAALKKHYGKKLFLPKTFSSGNQIKKLQGIYVPFWLFNGNAAAECYYTATNSHTHREGDYKVTRTDHFDVRRFGTVAFERIPTDASKKMPDDLMDSIEPFNYAEIKTFSMAYLPGYMADRYDVSIAESSQRADNRCAKTAKDLMRASVHGYQVVSERHSDVYIDRGEVHYALLPVWILKTKWQNRDYLFAMNGQTGKLVGNLPVSKGRFWGFCTGFTAVFTAALYFSGIGSFLGRMLILLFGN